MSIKKFDSNIVLYDKNITGKENLFKFLKKKNNFLLKIWEKKSVHFILP